MKRPRIHLVVLVWLYGLSLLGVACGNMGDQDEKLGVQESADSLELESLTLVAPQDTVAIDEALDPRLTAGIENGKYVTEVPFALTRSSLDRGRELFGSHCTPCHGAEGDGDGIVVERGFPAPPSYHTARMRAAPPGYLYDVITNGYGVMAPFRSRIPLEDRWRIAAWIRTLQWSRHATADTMPKEEWQRLLTEHSNRSDAE